MSEKKIQKVFIDTGLGFPVTLQNVPMIKIRGAWTPDIDYNLLTHSVLVALSEKPVKITGSEVKFIRLHFKMTLEQFAKRFSVTHVAVIKWEKTVDNPTKMSWAIEKDIRLFILNSLFDKPKTLEELYVELEKEKSAIKRGIKLDVDDFAA